MQMVSKLSAFIATMSLVSLLAVSTPAAWAQDTTSGTAPAPSALMPSKDMIDKMTEADYKAWTEKAEKMMADGKKMTMDGQAMRRDIRTAWSKRQGVIKSEKLEAEKKAMTEKREAQAAERKAMTEKRETDIKAMKEKKAADKKARVDTKEEKMQKKAGEKKAKAGQIK